jgi:hypothetical protein
MDPKEDLMKVGKILSLLILLLGTGVFAPSDSYRSVLNQWTRSGRDHELENPELRLKWHATYLSDQFRKVRRERLASLLAWTEAEKSGEQLKDQEELRQYDIFFIGVYAGSSAWSDIGRESARWRIVLDARGQSIAPLEMKKVPITDQERELFPFLDHWSDAYLIRFPKRIKNGESFSLKMLGIPAQSELVWAAR